MRIAYFDCFSGISGNMVLGALINIGLELHTLNEALASLKTSGYEIEAKKVLRSSIAGTLVDVKTQAQGVERRLRDILAIIDASALPKEVKGSSEKVFTRLAEAEAKVHGVDVAEVHFHEVGGLDAIVDIVGSVIGLNLLGIEEVYSSPLHLGRGFVDCAHGRLPVPAPATMELVRGVLTYGGDIEAELTTPTGAAIITTLAKDFGPSPLMEVQAIGYGAGHKILPIPNLLRLSMGEATEASEQGYEEDVATIMEANIDNMNPEFHEYVMEKFFERGALDVFLTPIQMKKGRPAVKLSVLVGESNLGQVIDVFFRETTTLGVRLYEARRKKLRRESIVVETRYGMVGIKVGKLGNSVMNISPEYEDCRKIASQHGIPLKEVYDEASRVGGQMLGRETAQEL